MSAAAGEVAGGDGRTRVKPHPAWRIWSNPIVRRYCRSRLRPAGLGVHLLITLIVAGFLFGLARIIASHSDGLLPMDADRFPFIPLLVLQGLILFILGTGQVAGGMTAESDEGVLDYQRLAPMTPLAKVLGYLFGLPVREYVLCLATFPFTLWTVWRGGIEVAAVAQLYLVFFSSAVLYHLTGLVAGTVVKNKRWAFLVSMGLVLALYTIVPQIANFGLVYLRYLTLGPVFSEVLPDVLPIQVGAAMEAARVFLSPPRFFDLSLPEAAFTLLTQGVLSLTLVVMLWRRWRREGAHLLGKGWAVGFFAWVQVVLLGNALPLVDSGLIFPSREFARRFAFRGMTDRRGWEPEPFEALAMAAAYGLFSLFLIWVLTLLVTPGRETLLRGWRRARKLGRDRLPLGADASTAFWAVAVMAVLGAAGWWTFVRGVVESRWFPGAVMPPVSVGAFALAVVTGALTFHALLEARGVRRAGLAGILVWVVPVLVGTVVGAVGNEEVAGPAVWVAGLSPATGPVYAVAATVPVGDIPLAVARAVPRAFWFWQGVGVPVAALLVVALYKVRHRVARSAGEG